MSRIDSLTSPIQADIATMETRQQFADAIKGFILLENTFDSSTMSLSHLASLQVQELELMIWARYAGLLGDEAECDMDWTVIHPHLAQLCHILSGADETVYSTQEDAVEYPTGEGSNVNALLDAEHLIARGLLKDVLSLAVRKDIVTKARTNSCTNWSRTRRFLESVTPKKFEDVVLAVSDPIRKLWSTAESLNRTLMQESLVHHLSHVIQNVQLLDELKSVELTLYKHLSDPEPSFARQMEDLITSARTKAARLEIGEGYGMKTQVIGTPMRAYTATRKYLLERIKHLVVGRIADFRSLNSAHTLGEATYNGDTVLVEWKSLEPATDHELYRQAQNLAILFGKRSPRFTAFSRRDMSTPDHQRLYLRGIAIDTDPARMAFVFDYPAKSIDQRVVTLTALLQETSACFTLEQRCDLGLHILKRMKHYHMAGWLHRNFSAASVLFAIPEEDVGNVSGGKETLEVPEPMLVGFDVARKHARDQGIVPGQIEDMESNLFRHPEIQNGADAPYKVYHDLYSLGVVLLEIAYWQPVGEIVHEIGEELDEDIDLTDWNEMRRLLLEAAGDRSPSSPISRLPPGFGNAIMLLLNNDEKCWQIERDDESAESQEPVRTQKAKQRCPVSVIWAGPHIFKEV